MKRTGFTLIELLVVIAIIATLVAILLPAVQQAREAARNSTCKNNLKQMMLGMHNFESSHKRFPSADNTANRVNFWLAQSLPYLEQNSLADLYNYNVSYNKPENKEAVQYHLPFTICPSTPGEPRLNAGFPAQPVSGDPKWPSAVSDYAGSVGVSSSLWTTSTTAPVPILSSVRPSNLDGFLAIYKVDLTNPGKSTPGRQARDIYDGLSNTIALVECAGRPQVWQKRVTATGTNSACGWAEVNQITIRGYTPDGVVNRGPCMVNCSNKDSLYSFHPGGANVALADGSVRMLSTTISTQTVADLLTIDGGEAVGEF